MIDYDKIEYSSVTDVGMVRSHNQDYHAALVAVDPEHWQQKGDIFLVADGMGGHAVGELAGELAASIIPHTYHKHAEEGPGPALRQAFVEANASINARGQQNLEFKGMGTTSTALLLRGDEAWVGHVGDSRAYRIRDGWIEQLTFDHSLVWEMARRQKKDPEELTDVRSNVIIRSLGPEPVVDVDVEGPYPLRPGDRFLLCSDGLSGQLSDAEIGAVVEALPPAEACRFLVNLANLHGGPDNITVVIVHVGGTAEGSVAASAAEPAPQPRWYRIPALITVFAGVVFAAIAALLATLKVSEILKLFAFALAAFGLFTGFLGLVVHYLQDRPRAPNRPKPRLPKVHRRTACPVDRRVVEHMAAIGMDLKQFIEQSNWETDWKVHDKHRQQAGQYESRGELTAAFREYCRSVRPFTEAIQRHRGRSEAFQPRMSGEK